MWRRGKKIGISQLRCFSGSSPHFHTSPHPLSLPDCRCQFGDPGPRRRIEGQLLVFLFLAKHRVNSGFFSLTALFSAETPPPLPPPIDSPGAHPFTCADLPFPAPPCPKSLPSRRLSRRRSLAPRSPSSSQRRPRRASTATPPRMPRPASCTSVRTSLSMRLPRPRKTT